MSPLFRFRRPFPTASEHDPAASSPHARTFEGRALDRPHEDVEDQGLAFDLGTLVDRRRMLGALGAGTALVVTGCAANGAASSSGTASAAPSASATTTEAADYDTEMPQETAGPYPGDGSNGENDVLEISGVKRRDLTTSIDGDEPVAGVPMTLTMNIVDMVNGDGPLTGAAVYVWHCDAAGQYSMYSSGVEDKTWLRGVQVVGTDGTVTFTSIVPGCYAGRWPHIHFEVYPDIGSITDSADAILTSQVALPQALCTKVYATSDYTGSSANLAQISLETDNVFSDGYDMQLATASGSVSSGYRLRIDVPIDTSTAPDTAGMGAPPA